ncbi:3576_t:CDS:2 [Diversispora eburnea]|uniref:3576_t:CDS:1 n=1 Tax=Diversispora eburnea TaxID=1213867 RepID=A0A9N9AGW9_9GLOM|nr:3576_t:CDS:2 [Diversispora eburnea]
MRPKNLRPLSAYLKPKAKDLPCLFAELVEKYSEAGLKSCEENKRFRSDTNEDNVIASIRFDTEEDNEIAPVNHSDVILELDKAKRLLELNQLEIQQKSRSIIDLNNQIIQMRQQLEGQRIEIEDLNRQLQKAYEDMAEIHNLYNEQLKAEREFLFGDVESLIRNNERFSIEKIMTYTSQDWLNNRNQVVVKFIETLIHNNQDTTLSKEKFFKTAVVIDAIYGAQHGKYVSEIQLAASAVKYSVAQSKMIINIDNHITSSGSYSQFQKWLEEFFVAFNMTSQNKIQHTDTP